MIPRFLVILILTSVISYSSAIPTSTEDDFGGVAINDLPSTVHLTIPSKEKDINVAKYYNATELKDLLDKMSTEFGSIMKVWTLGDARDGEQIWAVQITRGVNKGRAPMKPRFRFVANVHGDDALEYALMVTLIQHLVYNYEADNRITDLINSIDIWIVPTLRPDILRKAQVGHCESFLYGKKHEDEGNNDSMTDESSAESYFKSHSYDVPVSIRLLWQSHPENIIGESDKDPFALSGVLMGGYIVASYPLRQAGDNEIFVQLAKEYAQQNPMMARGDACKKSFPDGIVGGSPWSQDGDVQQYEFEQKSNCVELTLFLGCCKYPEPRLLPNYWEANREAMMHFIASTRRGVYGVVKDEEGSLVPDVVITVEGHKKEITVNNWSGEFWILLLPGTYTITARFDALYNPKTITVDVTENEPYVHQDFIMEMSQVTVAIRGRVTDEDNKLVEGAVIKLEGEESEKHLNKDGTYHLDLVLRKKETQVSVSAPGYVKRVYTVKRQDMTESDRALSHDFKLIAQGFGGKIRDASGNPVKNAVVKITGENIDKEIKVTKLGNFHIKPLALGTYTMTVTAPDFMPDVTKDIQLTEARPVRDQLWCTLQRVGNNSESNSPTSVFKKLWH